MDIEKVKEKIAQNMRAEAIQINRLAHFLVSGEWNVELGVKASERCGSIAIGYGATASGRTITGVEKRKINEHRKVKTHLEDTTTRLEYIADTLQNMTEDLEALKRIAGL